MKSSSSATFAPETDYWKRKHQLNPRALLSNNSNPAKEAQISGEQRSEENSAWNDAESNRKKEEMLQKASRPGPGQDVRLLVCITRTWISVKIIYLSSFT